MGTLDQREAYRFATELKADCRSCSRSWTSRLCNISTSGCMIICPEPGLPGDALLRLRLRGLTAIDGRVVWQHRGHAGIKFLSPLHQAVLDHLGLRQPDVATADAAPARIERPRSRGATSLHGQLVKRLRPEEEFPPLAKAG